MIPLDHSIPLGETEIFDIQVLNHYLHKAAPAVGEVISISKFPGGFSNITYCLKTASKEWVLRMPPAGAHIQSAHDMGREFRVLGLLKIILIKYPR